MNSRLFTSITSSAAIRETGRYGISDSLRLDAGELDHLGPLLGFGRDEICELGGRTGEYRRAQIGDTCSYFRVRESRVDLLVEFVNDFGRRVLGRADPVPRVRLNVPTYLDLS